MRKLSAMLFGIVMFVPAALAEPLPAGRPAGVQKAMSGNTGMILLVATGVAVITVAAGIAMGGGFNSSSGTSS